MIKLLSYGGCMSSVALLVILIIHCSKRFFSLISSCFSKRHAVSYDASHSNPRTAISQFRSLQIVSEADLKFLIEKLEEKHGENEKWEHVIDKRNNLVSYSAKCCKSKDAPIKYLSVTVFENCSPEILRNFYMDSDYRKQWDKTLVEHTQLQVDRTNGIEVGHTIKKFPLLMPREYVLGWKLWEGKDKTFYCFIKECEHPSAPRQRKYVRVGFFRSGWRIRKVPRKNACEIKMFHQEDTGLNVEMAKLAFAKGIWSYVCKMDNALRKYSGYPRRVLSANAISLIQKVPSGLETMDIGTGSAGSPAMTVTRDIAMGEAREKRSPGRGPSRKALANGLLLIGGVICLSRGNSSLGAKAVMAYILTKLRKRDSPSSSSQSRER